LIWFILPTQILLFAQQGKLDNSFNVIDDGQYIDGFTSTVRTLLIQQDGNLIVGGDYLTRLNPDGTIDDSFRTGTGFNGKIYCSFLQADGKIIIGGSFTMFNGNPAGRIVRLNSDGSYDASFNTTIGATTGIVYDIDSQSDGKIIISGSFTKYNSATVNRVARLLPNGTLDTSFLTNAGSALSVTHVKILPNQKIILTGNFTTFNGTPANRIIRLNTNGSFDSSFISGTGFNDDVNAIALQPDGKMILGGNFTNYNSIEANRIIRLNEDGTVDPTFATGSGLSKDAVEIIKINGNGDIMVGGSFTGFYNNLAVTRLVFLNSDGTLKTDFDIGTGPSSASVFAIESDQDDSWFIGGSFSIFDGQNQGKLVKISSQGEVDFAYLPSEVGFDNSVLTILPLPNKKLIVGGNFKKFNGSSVSKIVRLLENGSNDISFNPDNSGANNLVKTTILQPDHKIILGGNFTKYNDVLNNRIVRILENGALDNSFNTGEGFNAQVYSLALQSDQKIIVGGAFIKYNGSANTNRIVRLLPNGSKDPSFDVGSGADNTVETIVLQPDGKILIGGHFKNFNGLPFAGLVRLNPDGTIDSSFKIKNGFDKYVFAIALQPDQKILVGGTFLTFDGVSQKRILRLNANGSLDTSFDSGTGFSKIDVRAILLQPDGRILVGGSFSGTFNNIPASRLIRLMPSGAFDNSFSAPLNNTLSTMSFTEDYKLVIGGIFNTVSGISKHRIARLKLCVDKTIWNGISWSNGFPSSGKDVFFKEDYPNLTTASVCGCDIDENKTVTLLEKNTLSVEFAYTGLGTLVLENDASLYQNDNEIINTGIIHLKRRTSPLVRYDLTYWSSPVDNQKMSDFSPDTLLDKYFWYDPNSGWISDLGGTMKMAPGQGYSIRAPQNFSITDRAVFEGVFKGVPNNGKFYADISVANRCYLVGNPYPSAISADAFLKSNLKKIKGGIYFWTHNTPLTNYEYTKDDFAVYNLLGGVGTGAALGSGVSNGIPDGTIASGQGFFLKSNEIGPMEFNDEMRILGSNSSFFKPAKDAKINSEIEKYRFWLNLKSQTNISKQILIGYIDGASNALDLSYDAESLSSNLVLDFYSSIENKKLIIQGRSLPFLKNDSIVLGYKTSNKGVFHIEIDHQDRFFNEKEIFLVDKSLNKIHNLSEKAYEFESEIGNFNNRFVIIFNDKTLKIKDIKEISEEVLISVYNHIISVESVNVNLKEVMVYNISGQKLYCKDSIEERKITIQKLFAHQILFVKVLLENGKVESKKIMF